MTYNPWRLSLENCISGDNFLRRSEWYDLIEELDRLYSIEDAPLTKAAPAMLKALKQIVHDWDGEPEDMFEARAAISAAAPPRPTQEMDHEG